MNDGDKIPKTDFTGSLRRYDGRFGYPTFGDIKPLLPEYFWNSCGDWSKWDECNKVTVLLKWVDRRESLEWVEKETRQLAESQKRHAAEQKQREANEEEERLKRLAKNSERLAEREHGKQIVAAQMECSARKKVDALLDEANEFVASVGKLVALLRRIPADRLAEVDLESFLFNSDRVRKIYSTDV